MPKNYRYFLFDLDRTLWDFDSNAQSNIFELIAKYDLPIDDKNLFFKTYEKINHTLWAKYEKGMLAKERLRWQRFYDTLVKFGITDEAFAKKMGEDYLENMPNQQILMPYAKDVLSVLKERGAKMALVTNGFKEVQYRKIKNSGIDIFFDAVLISEEQGILKPSPVIFKKALCALSGSKSEAIMVGDDFEKDIEGAMIYGIDQFFYNYKSVPCNGGPTYNSSDLRDLLTISSSAE